LRRAAAVEHRPVLRIDDLDAQAFGRDVEQQLVLERCERLALRDRFLELRFSASSCFALASSAICFCVGRVDGGEAAPSRPAPRPGVCCTGGASRPPPQVDRAELLAPPGPVWPGAGFGAVPCSMLGFLK
jgi:hypothetical protein